MAGHSKFKNIMHRKGRQDAKRAKVFTKLIRELTVAAKTGQPDPDMNPRLRTAIAAAKAAKRSSLLTVVLGINLFPGISLAGCAGSPSCR